MSSEPFRMMLGFVVRQCAAALGHDPTPGELAEWANNQRDHRGAYRLFGRPISLSEAKVILRHPQRLVAINGIRVEGLGARADAVPSSKVIAFDPARRRYR